MGTISVMLKKGEEKESFPEPRSVSLISVIKEINKKNLSLEEAEEKAGITKGTILKAIKSNDVLLPMDAYKLSDVLFK
jgi:hypothetical protein